MESKDWSISEAEEPFETLNVQIKFVGVDVTKQTSPGKVLRQRGREFQASRFGTWVFHEGDKEDDVKTILINGGAIGALVWGILKAYPEITVWVTDLTSYRFALDMKKSNKTLILDEIGKGEMGKKVEKVLRNLTVTDAYKHIKIKLVKILREFVPTKEKKPGPSNETTEISRLKKLDEAEKIERFMQNQNFSWAFMRLKTLLERETDDAIKLQLSIRLAICLLHLKEEKELESRFVEIIRLMKSVVIPEELFLAYVKDCFTLSILLKKNKMFVRSIEISLAWTEKTKQTGDALERVKDIVATLCIVCDTINEFMSTEPGVLLKVQMLHYTNRMEKAIEFMKNIKDCDSLTMSRNVFYAESALAISRNRINDQPTLTFGRETKEFNKVTGCWGDMIFVTSCLQRDPRTRFFVLQDDFMKTAHAISENRNLLKEKLSDPQIALANEVLLAHSDNINFVGDTTSVTSERSSIEELLRSGMFDSEAAGPTEPRQPDTANKAQAQIEKEKGNEAYKRKKFEEAIWHYDKASFLDPTNAIFHSNKAAVYIEQKQLDLARLACGAAIHLSENNDDYSAQDIAKMYARLGRTEMLDNNHGLAARRFESSLQRHFDPKVKELFDACNKKLFTHWNPSQTK